MASTLRKEERLGLVVALAAHAALVALLVLRPLTPDALPQPERMTVTLSEDVGLTSTSPEPQAQAAPDEAPEIAEVPAPPLPPPPLPQPRPEPAREEPLPKPRPTPKPVPRATATPRPRPSPPPRAAPSPPPKPAAKASPAAQPSARPAPRATPRPAGGSRIGDDFLKGQPDARSTGTARNPPAATIGPAVQSALAGAISRQLKPRWVAPQGAEAEKLVTILAWSLNRDGSLAGTPRVVRQDGITDANRPQAARHAEQAVRAVQLAAPFDLPDEYYDAWKRVTSFRFDKRLSQ